MAFESLTERLQGVFKNLRRKGKLSEKEVQEVTKEIRLALLEADVALPVVKTFIKRVRFADDIPVAYEIASIPEKIIRGFKESDITEHFFKTLTDNGYEIGKSQQTISASLANSSLAKHLKVKTGDALLSLTQISFLQDGQAFEYVRSYYVGDRFEFYLENN